MFQVKDLFKQTWKPTHINKQKWTKKKWRWSIVMPFLYRNLTVTAAVSKKSSQQYIGILLHYITIQRISFFLHSFITLNLIYYAAVLYVKMKFCNRFLTLFLICWSCKNYVRNEFRWQYNFLILFLLNYKYSKFCVMRTLCLFNW